MAPRKRKQENINVCQVNSFSSELPEADAKDRRKTSTRHKRIRELKVVSVICIVLVGLNLLCMKATFKNPDGVIQPWQPFVVWDTIVIALYLMAIGYPAEIILLTLTASYQAAGIISLEQAFSGFSNKGNIAIAFLFIVAKGIQETGSLEMLMKTVLGHPTSVPAAQARLGLACSSCSGFLNNTPIVAMMIPIVENWSHKTNIRKDKLMIPLSFATLTGGGLTMLGSSINVISVSKAQTMSVWPSGETVGFFEYALIGGPIVITTLIYTLVVSPFLLYGSALSANKQRTRSALTHYSKHSNEAVIYYPEEKLGDPLLEVDTGESGEVMTNNTTNHQKIDDVKKKRHASALKTDLVTDLFGTFAGDSFDNTTDHLYWATFYVPKGSPVVGQRLEKTGLTRVVEATLHEVHSQESIRTNSVTEMRLHEEDRLYFSVTPRGLANLRKKTEIYPTVQKHIIEMGPRRRHRSLYEACISPEAELIGHTLCTFDFMKKFTACVLAIRRNTEVVVQENLSDIEFQAGDCLIVEAEALFEKSCAEYPCFSIIKKVDNSKPPRTGQLMDNFRLVSDILAMVAMLSLAASKTVELPVAACLTALFMILNQTLTIEEAWGAVKGPILLTIAAAFGVAAALSESGLASVIAENIGNLLGNSGEIAVFFGLYMVTAVISSLISNNACVILMLPVGLETAANLDMNMKAVLFLLIYASSASFCTPIGYQTNLMVQEPGGYLFKDYARFGGPLQVILAVVTCFTCYLLFQTIFPCIALGPSSRKQQKKGAQVDPCDTFA